MDRNTTEAKAESDTPGASSPSERFKGLRFVAVADILGFKSLLDRLPLEEIAERVALLLDGIASLSVHFVLSSDQHRARVYRPNGANFSDSVILWSEAFDDLGQGFPIGLMFSQCLAQLIAGAYLAEIPLRVGVAFGETLVDRKRNIIIGKPVADAFLLEKAQEWVGGAYHTSVPPEIGRIDGIGVEYAVPLKERPETTCRAAVDWCYYNDKLSGQLLAELESATTAFCEHLTDAHTLAKYANTRSFYTFRLRPLKL